MAKSAKRGRAKGRKGGTKKSKSTTTTSSIITPPKSRYLPDGRDPRLYRRNLEPSDNLETISDVPKKMSRKFKLKPTRATVEFIEVSKTPTPEELSYIPKIKRGKKIKSKKKRKKIKENIEFIIVEDF
jgi:hypothetical protein